MLLFSALAAAPDSLTPIILPLFELPDQLFPQPGWPSFDQAIGVGTAVERLSILGVQRGFEAAFPNNKGLQVGLGMAASGLAAGVLTFAGSWTHEEAHRAVLRNRGISSRNGLYHLEAWSNGTISVDHVSDAELEQLKAEHPADTVRLMSAGMEAQSLINLTLGDAAFYGGGHSRTLGPLYLGNTWMYPTMVATELSTLFYRFKCASSSNDVLTEAETKLRLTEESRDFTGLDCTAWVYELRRPDEPYSARGPHPYGEGVDRYISWSDLTKDEQHYLENQVLLSLIDFLNPHLYGIDGFLIPQGRWIAQAGYMPAPWGYQLFVHGGLNTGKLKAGLELQAGVSQAGLQPGIELQWREIPLNPILKLDLGVGGWLQPEALRWDAEKRSPGGRLWSGLNVMALPWLAIRPEVEAKTEGFVAGNVHLDAAVNGRLKVVVWVP